MAGTAFRLFGRRLAKGGGWLSRVAIGGDATPVYPPLYIQPSTTAPTATAVSGDMYVDANGVLQVHNGTNYVLGGGGNIVINHMFDAATAVDRNAFIADRAYQLVSAKAVHTTASTSGTLDLEKCSSTTAVGSGTSMLTGTLNLAGTANTTVSGTLSSTAADTKLAAGDRVGYDFGGTVTNLVGAVITTVWRPI